MRLNNFAKKNSLKVLLLVLVLPFVGCNAGNNDLSFSLSQTTAIFIDAPAISCTSLVTAEIASQGTTPVAATEDVSPIQFQMPHITVNWTKKSSPFTLYWILFQIKSPAIAGGTYSCQIAGADLLYDWLYDGYSPTSTITNITITAADGTSGTQPLPASPVQGTIYTSNTCATGFYCGSIQMVDSTKSSFGTGIVYMYGTYSNGSGSVSSVQAQQPFTFNYTGVGSK